MNTAEGLFEPMSGRKRKSGAEDEEEEFHEEEEEENSEDDDGGWEETKRNDPAKRLNSSRTGYGKKQRNSDASGGSTSPEAKNGDDAEASEEEDDEAAERTLQVSIQRIAESQVAGTGNRENMEVNDDDDDEEDDNEDEDEEDEDEDFGDEEVNVAMRGARMKKRKKLAKDGKLNIGIKSHCSTPIMYMPQWGLDKMETCLSLVIIITSCGDNLGFARQDTRGGYHCEDLL